MPRLASGGSPPAARCAAGPRTRRDGRPPGLPSRAAITHAALRTRNSHTHYPGFGAVMPRQSPPGLPAAPPRTAFLLYNVKTANRVQPHRENQQNGSRNPAKRHSDRNALFQIRAPAPGDKPPENNRDEPTRTLDNVA